MMDKFFSNEKIFDKIIGYLALIYLFYLYDPKILFGLVNYFNDGNLKLLAFLITLCGIIILSQIAVMTLLTILRGIKIFCDREKFSSMTDEEIYYFYLVVKGIKNEFTYQDAIKYLIKPIHYNWLSCKPDGDKVVLKADEQIRRFNFSLFNFNEEKARKICLKNK
jgi:hypothetical protein